MTMMIRRGNFWKFENGRILKLLKGAGVFHSGIAEHKAVLAYVAQDNQLDTE